MTFENPPVSVPPAKSSAAALLKVHEAKFELPDNYFANLDAFTAVAYQASSPTETTPQEVARSLFVFRKQTAAEDLKLLGDWLLEHEEQGAVCKVFLSTRAQFPSVEHPLKHLQLEGLRADPTQAALASKSMSEYQGHHLLPYALSEAFQPSVWGLDVSDAGVLCIWFEHGIYGLHEEHPSALGRAFFRLAALTSGELAWSDFGSAESQMTLLDKGQFYIQAHQHPATAKPLPKGCAVMVPVDHFFFEATHGQAIKLESVGGHRTVLAWNNSQAGGSSGAAYARESEFKDESLYEWFEDRSAALARMADVLEGAVSPEVFGTCDEDDNCEKTKLQLARELILKKWTQGQAWMGKLVTTHIFEDNDLHHARLLEYRANDDRRVALIDTEVGWQFRAMLSRSDAREVQTTAFAEVALPQAIRCFAGAMKTGVAQGSGSEAG